MNEVDIKTKEIFIGEFPTLISNRHIEINYYQNETSTLIYKVPIFEVNYIKFSNQNSN